MSNLDHLRREAVDLGYVLLDARQAENIVHNVSGVYRERMEENAQAMDSLAASLRAGETVALWAPGEQGAVAAESLARQFRQQSADMGKIADACDRILMVDDSRMVVMSYDEEGVVVNDYEHNDEERFVTEREALPYFLRHAEAVKAMSKVEG